MNRGCRQLRRLTLLAGGAVLPAAMAEPNAIPDPSFEEPAATSRWSSADGASGLTTDRARSGRQSLWLRNHGQGVRGTALHYAGQAGVPVAGVSPGREYVFAVHVRAEDVSGVGAGGKPLVVLRWRDAAGKALGAELYDWAPYGTYDFQRRILHLQAPEGAARIDVGFRSWWDCLTGVTYWDDASLVPRTVPGRGGWLAAYEAEEAAGRSDVRVAREIDGFHGSGYLVPTADGAVIEWDQVAGGGPRVLAVRYSWEGAARALELFVGGASQGRRVPVCTGRRGSYATENWAVVLPPGRNAVRLMVRIQGAQEKICPLIDRLEVYERLPPAVSSP